MQIKPAISLLAAVVPLWISAVTAVAQTNGGSTYSVFNIGDLVTSSSAAAAGRGGVEASVPYQTVLNSINPALWSSLQYVTVQAGVDFEQFQVSDADNTLYQNNSRIKEFAIGIPYSEDYGGTIGFSIRPYSHVNYRSEVRTEVPTTDPGQTTEGVVTFQGNGGVSRLMLGGSFAPAEWLTLGLAAGHYFGTIEERSLVTFPQASFNQATYFRNDLFTGWGGKVGVQLQPTEWLFIGGAAELGVDLERERHFISSYVDGGNDVIDTTDVATSTVAVPPKFTFGASARSGRFLFSGQGSVQSWSKETFETAGTESMFGVGIDRLPNESVNASGFERWDFRLGGYLGTTYYDLPDGSINTWGVAVGAGIPLTTVSRLNANMALDVALEFGSRGSTSNGLTQELFGKIHVGLSVSELWFVRRN